MSGLTPEQRKAERLAKLFDLRSFIGSLFVIFGVIVTLTGLTATQAEIDKAAGINLSLWMGLIILAVGIFFVAWTLAAPPQVVHGHEVSKEDIPEQMRDEHLLGGH
jgi:xanthine/uracil/vitamin C permease (AzgA family)